MNKEDKIDYSSNSSDSENSGSEKEQKEPDQFPYIFMNKDKNLIDKGEQEFMELTEWYDMLKNDPKFKL